VHTQRTILLIVAGIGALLVVEVAALVLAFGWAGAATAASVLLVVAVGFGRPGWYSYDRMPWHRRWGATDDWQDLEVGDHILMTPELGFEVQALERDRCLVARGADGTTWCLHLDEPRSRGDHPGCGHGSV